MSPDPFPSNSATPLVASSKPARIYKRELFPHPEGPSKTTNSPDVTSRFIFFSATTGLTLSGFQVLEIFFILSQSVI